uniref:Secreted protein n=1 Tax=Cacopsylla melanoneura TaxID=428564 RepID=A0A8D8QTV3_9HEMI
MKRVLLISLVFGAHDYGTSLGEQFCYHVREVCCTTFVFVILSAKNGNFKSRFYRFLASFSLKFHFPTALYRVLILLTLIVSTHFWFKLRKTLKNTCFFKSSRFVFRFGAVLEVPEDFFR